MSHNKESEKKNIQN